MIKDVKRVANEGRVDILFFTDGSIWSRPINEEVSIKSVVRLSVFFYLTFRTNDSRCSGPCCLIYLLCLESVPGLTTVRHTSIPKITHSRIPPPFGDWTDDIHLKHPHPCNLPTLLPLTVDVDYLERHQIYYSNTPKAVS